MSALMDLLANAATNVTAVHDSEAASILQQLFSSGRESSDVSASDAEQTAAAMGEAEADETPRPWTREEDELLRRLVAAKMGPQAAKRGPGKAPAAQLETREWRQIAENFDNRTAMQCAHRFQKVANPENVKGPWSASEDEQLVELVGQYGGKHWARIASMLPGRTGKQCRERWCNNLDPSLKKGAWTPEEDETILRLHSKLGTRWAEIAKCLPGRSDNSVKNRWYSTCSRILRQQQEAAAAAAEGSGRVVPAFKPDYGEPSADSKRGPKSAASSMDAAEATSSAPMEVTRTHASDTLSDGGTEVADTAPATAPTTPSHSAGSTGLSASPASKEAGGAARLRPKEGAAASPRERKRKALQLPKPTSATEGFVKTAEGVVSVAPFGSAATGDALVLPKSKTQKTLSHLGSLVFEPHAEHAGGARPAPPPNAGAAKAPTPHEPLPPRCLSMPPTWPMLSVDLPSRMSPSVGIEDGARSAEIH